MAHFTKGDGSFKKLLDAGQCPRCKVQVPCGCGLQIIDGEVNMNETKLMPTEEDLMIERGDWAEAVSVIQKVLDEYLYDPEPVADDHEREVLEAWKRILQG